MDKTELNIHEFKKFVDAISKVSTQTVIELEDNKCRSISVNDDGINLLTCTWCDVEDNISLNIKDVSSFSRMLSVIGDDMSIHVDNNSFTGRSSTSKFKYYLLDDGIIPKPKVSMDDIESYTHTRAKNTCEFTLTADIVKLLKKAGTTIGVDKFYFYTDKNNLLCDVTDRSNSSIDCYSIVIQSDVQFVLDPISFNISVLFIMSNGSNEDIQCTICDDTILFLDVMPDDQMLFRYVVAAYAQ